MTDLRTAAQQALEALEYYQHRRLEWDYSDEAAITALRAALAEQVQEPVALNDGRLWQYPDGSIGIGSAPPQRPAEPVQEPVAWRFEARHIDSAWAAAVTLKHPGPEGVYMRNVVPLYTAPPQRKPLTEAEIDSIWDSEKAFADIYAIARAVERAHNITGDNT